MADNTTDCKDSSGNNDFLIVDRSDQMSEKRDLEVKIFALKQEILFLKSWKIACVKFQEKFFELFIAFTVLVTPLAVAFVFNYLFSNGRNFTTSKGVIYNCTSCPNDLDNLQQDKKPNADQNGSVCCLLVPPSSNFYLRDSFVPILIAISFIVGLPYYYHMMSELGRTNEMREVSGLDDSDSEDEDELICEGCDECDVGKEGDGEKMKMKKEKVKKIKGGDGNGNEGSED